MKRFLASELAQGRGVRLLSDVTFITHLQGKAKHKSLVVLWMDIWFSLVPSVTGDLGSAVSADAFTPA